MSFEDKGVTDPNVVPLIRAAHTDTFPPTDQTAATGAPKETDKALADEISDVFTVDYPWLVGRRSRPAKSRIHKGAPRKNSAHRQ